MKHISKVTWTALAIMLFSVCACSGKHEEQGKKLDNLKDNTAKKFEEGKETAHNLKENAEKKTREFHDKSKEKAHELINKS